MLAFDIPENSSLGESGSSMNEIVMDLAQVASVAMSASASVGSAMADTEYSTIRILHTRHHFNQESNG